MAEPFLSEIRITSFGFAPRGWAMCDGQILPINQNQGLFSLLGTTFGGDGRTTFGLPDLRGRVPIHAGNGHVLGERGGSTAVTIQPAQMPVHSHSVAAASRRGTEPDPSGTVLAAAGGEQYGPPSNLAALHLDSVGDFAGGGQAHLNLQPYQVLSFMIALQGIFPSPS
ncbi:phage tail protein [Vulgatibacter incomptus]|uniref:Microcystin dependent protein n=1 Tax=Vulgatibacter incomptus TaxID=1391653 RepID=A0A0K1PFT1_9BACT|nr:tail fiber protein [Vulgatibacter incomptus]AKU91974.1 Microcystin dependent protein [Vulgatibacter incomptus]